MTTRNGADEEETDMGGEKKPWETGDSALAERIDDLSVKVDGLAHKTSQLTRTAALAAEKAQVAANNTLDGFQRIGELTSAMARLEASQEVLAGEMRTGFAELRGKVRDHAQSLVDLQELQEQPEDDTTIRTVKAVARDAVQGKIDKIDEAERRVKVLEDARKAEEDAKRQAIQKAELAAEKWKERFWTTVFTIIGLVVTSIVLKQVFHIG